MSRTRALTLGLAAALLVVAAPGVSIGSPCSTGPCAVAEADVTQGLAPLTVNFTGSNSLPASGQSIQYYTWDLGDGMPFKISTNTQHTYTAPGGYTATLTITQAPDETEYTDYVFISVGTADGTYPPTITSATANPVEGAVPPGLGVVFNATVADLGTGGQTYWRLGIGDPLSGTQRNFTYSDPGRYRTRFEAIGATGLVSLSQPIDINVKDGTSDGPLVRATAETTTHGPPVGPPPLRITLSASPTSLPTYDWDLGDGRTSSGAQLTASYELPGTYWARLVGTDPAGRKGYDEVRIVVTEGDWPAAVVSVPGTRACVGDAYGYQAEARGTPTVSFSLTTAPTGMTVDATGKVSWTPTAAQVGSNAVTLQAQNAAGQDDQQFAIEVSCCTADACPAPPGSSGCSHARSGAGAAGLFALVLAGALLRARRRR